MSWGSRTLGVLLVINLVTSFTNGDSSAKYFRENRKAVNRKQSWPLFTKVHKGYNQLLRVVENFSKRKYGPKGHAGTANHGSSSSHRWSDRNLYKPYQTNEGEMRPLRVETRQRPSTVEVPNNPPYPVLLGYTQTANSLLMNTVGHHAYAGPIAHRLDNTEFPYRLNSKLLFRPNSAEFPHRESNAQILHQLLYSTLQNRPPLYYRPPPLQQQYAHVSHAQGLHILSNHGFEEAVVSSNNWPTHVQPVASSAKEELSNDWSDITVPLGHYPIVPKPLYDQAFHASLHHLLYILKNDAGENDYSTNCFWTHPEWLDPTSSPFSYPSNFSYPDNRLIIEGFSRSHNQDFQGRGDDIDDFPQKFIEPDLKLCQERINKGFKFEYINYYLSTEDPQHTHLDRAAQHRQSELFTWMEAFNVCRKRCMAPIAFEDELKFSVCEKIPRIWTGGRLCNSRDCRDFHHRKPWSIFGWTWSGSAGSIPRVDRVPERFTSRPWSSTGPLGCAQPDNAEFYVRKVTESCVALLNNEYEDGVTLHDLACYHKLPVLCQDDESLIQYAESIYKVQLPRYPNCSVCTTC